MGQLKKNAGKFIICFVVGIITGILLGIISISILVSYRLDKSYEKVAILENTIIERDIGLQKLEKSINNMNIVLKDIEIVLNFDGDEIDKIDMKKIINDEYTSLLGKEIKTIDPDIVLEVIDDRILRLKEKKYILRVNRLILTEVLKISVIAEPYDL